MCRTATLWHQSSGNESMKTLQMVFQWIVREGGMYIKKRRPPNERKRTVSPKNAPPPPKSTVKQGDGTHAKAKKPKVGASSSQQSPKVASKPPPNKALGTFAAHFKPSQQTQNERDATGGANSEMPGEPAPQANGGQFTGKGAKPKVPGLRRRR